MTAQETTPLLEAIEGESPTCIRGNPAKSKGIQENWISGGVPWCKEAVILKSRPPFFADPALHAGVYYVQEASSTIVGYLAEQLLQNIDIPALALDLCGAPGGKSTHLASKLRDTDILIANEVIHSRTPILNENLCKWGSANHIITRAEANKLGSCGLSFDLIVADMPCSGEGMFRKDPQAVSEWSLDNVNLCSGRQMRIAHDIWPSLKTGGYMIYSTCTYNRLENEDNVERICRELGGEVVEFSFPEEWGILSLEKGMYRLLPHRTVGEGFFFAVIQKTSTHEPVKRKDKFRNNQYKSVQINEIKSQNLQLYQRNEEVYACHGSSITSIFEILDKLPMIYAPGSFVGKAFEKKNGLQFKPESVLALISQLDLEYPTITVNIDDAIRYLNRQSLPNSDKKSGWHQVVWNGISVGFANGLHAHWNNSWPMEWRLRAENTTPFTLLV